jgi:hypothetical protein
VRLSTCHVAAALDTHRRTRTRNIQVRETGRSVRQSESRERPSFFGRLQGASNMQISGYWRHGVYGRAHNHNQGADHSNSNATVASIGGDIFTEMCCQSLTKHYYKIFSRHFMHKVDHDELCISTACLPTYFTFHKQYLNFLASYS